MLQLCNYYSEISLKMQTPNKSGVCDFKKTSMSKQLATAQLQADYNDLRRFVDSLPEEIKRQVQKQKSQNQIR